MRITTRIITSTAAIKPVVPPGTFPPPPLALSAPPPG
jgi:hypothetical protein